MAQRELTIIVPTSDNQGKSLWQETQEIENTLLALAGGFSRDQISGAWLGSNGTRFNDASTRYTVICTSAVATAIKTLVPQWCALTHQEALYFGNRSAGVSFILPTAA